MPPTLASLATWHPPSGYELVLFDANEERLDLLDRLARTLFGEYNKQVAIFALSDLKEAIGGVSDLILCLNEDGSRRMIGPRVIRSFEALETSSDPSDLRRGDPNRPTPSSQLSAATKSMLEVPQDSNLGREQAILAACKLVLDQVDPSVRILNLMRGIHLVERPNLTSQDWPAPISESDIPGVPFQILRWISGEDPVFNLIQDNDKSIIKQWLSEQSSYPN